MSSDPENQDEAQFTDPTINPFADVEPTSQRHGVDYTVEPVYATTDVNGRPLSPEERKAVREFEMDDISHVETNWKSSASRDQWGHAFSQLTYARSEAEWRSVLDGETERKAAIIHIRTDQREKWLKRLSEADLAYETIMHTEQYEGYSHTHTKTDSSNPHRQTYAVVAQNQDIADKMKEIHHNHDTPDRHKLIGELLGFPTCCMDFFDKVWNDANIQDPMYEVACNTSSAEAVDGDHSTILIPDPNPGANPLWRYWGAAYITHIPCSFDCDHSIDIARERYRIMCEHGFEDEARAINQWLELPHSWSANNGLARISNRHLLGRTHTTPYLDKKEILWKGNPEGRDIVEEFNRDLTA